MSKILYKNCQVLIKYDNAVSHVALETRSAEVSGKNKKFIGICTHPVHGKYHCMIYAPCYTTMNHKYLYELYINGKLISTASKVVAEVISIDPGYTGSSIYLKFLDRVDPNEAKFTDECFDLLNISL